jgi:fimbrial isopeptide formation D2 family protein/uncharacterized repeat protein (TIGR01451 family)
VTAARPVFARFLRALACALAFLVPALALRAAPDIGTPATSFTAAESGRAYMTVGGVWNGSAEVTNTTGDTFTVTYTNTGDATAFDFTPVLTLPNHFAYVPGTATVVTSPATPGLSVTPSVVGNTVTFNLSLAGTPYDLPAASSITLTYGLRTTTSITSGTYQLTHNRTYALANNDTPLGPGVNAQQNILVRAGDSIINVTPKQQTKAVGETATFTIKVTNTGLGGIFDVTIDEAAIYPNGANLAFVSLAQTAPASPASTPSNAGSRLTLPYLAPGDTFIAEAQALVLACGSIVNVVTSAHRANPVPVTDTVPVQLDLRQPLVDFTPPPVALDYNNPVTVTIPILNAGLGSAYNFRLQSNLNTGGRTIALTPASITAGWTYNSSNGLFTYSGGSPAGLIPSGPAIDLSFTVDATNPCSATGAGTVTYTALYQNGCGDDYSIPIRTQTLSAPADTPSISLAQTVSSTRIAVAETGTYTLTASATNLANINPSGVTITDTLPAQVSYTGHTASVGTVNIVGQTLAWTLSTADLASPRTLDIQFQVVNEPCNAGQQPTNTASTSNVTTTRGCILNASAPSTFFISNNPGLQASQFFNHTGSSPYESGNPDAAPLGLRDTAEGEFIPLEAGYQFGAAYPGTWAGSTYTDGFGGVAGMTLAPGSLTVTGTFGTVAVPGASITPNALGFTLDLGFLAGPAFFNNPDVANRAFTLNYRVTAPDSALGSGHTLSVLHRVDLFLANGGGGAGICAQAAQNRFTQGAFYTLERARAQVALSLPSILEICRDELLTLTVSNANSQQARNLLLTLLNDGTHYTYDTSYAPVYGGTFNSGNITYSPNAGLNPSFQFTGGPLTGTGTIQVRVRRAANGNTTPGPLAARVDFDSWQTAPAVGRVYNTTGSYTPASVRRANLALTVSPGTISVTGSTISYITFVSNTDAGAGFGTTLVNTLPVGFTVNTTLTNALNPSYPVSTSAGPGGRQTLTWALGDLPSGATIPIVMVANVGVIPGCSVTLDPGIDRIQAYWGCDSQAYSTVTRASPSFVFPAGKMQIVHDSTQTIARLCSPGKIVITVKNTGPTSIQGVIVRDVIPPDEGLTISGTVQYSLNNGPLQNVAATHTGTGTPGNPYTWTSTQIPALAQLVPVGVSGTNQVTIEITLASSEDLAAYNPELIASGEAVISCGSPVLSPAQPFTIPVERPAVSIVKTGRNLTAGDLAYSDTVYGGVGDVVEWRFVITNSGSSTASNLRFADQLSGSGGPAEFSSVAGLGGGGSAYTANTVLSLPDLNTSSSLTRYIRETLGATCVTASPEADISWGCTNNGASVRSAVTEPGTPVDNAEIRMNPTVVGGTTLTQSVSTLPGGRALVTVSITNTGGTLYAPVATITLPSYAVHDTTGPVTLLTPTADITSVSRTGGSDSAPVFTFDGPGAPHLLRFGQTIVFSYHVRPTTFDTTQASSFPDLAAQESAPSLDPAIPAPANITTQLDYTNSCGSPFLATHDSSLPLARPDLDITAVGPNSGNSILTATTTQGYTFTITNVGDLGSIADRITLSLPELGPGWAYNSATLTTPGTGGTGGTAALDSGVWTFTPAQVGTLAQNQSALVTVSLTYDSASSSGSLSLRLRARGESRSHDGSVITGDYSLDRRAQRVLGVELLKERTATSEPDPSSSGNFTLIGEDVTYRTTIRFRGAVEDITNILVREQLRRGARTGNNDGNFGLVRSGASPYVTVTQGSVSSVVSDVDAGFANANALSRRLTFSLPNLSAAATATGATTEYSLVARLLNLPAGGNNNNDNATRTVRAGLQFDYLGTTFHPPTANNHGGLDSTGLSSSGVPVSGLYQQSQIVVRRPGDTDLGVVKTARNLTRSTLFAASTSGEAGDIVEYRLVITNNASSGRPFHSLRVADAAPAKLNISAANQGADNNVSPDSIEVFTSAPASGLDADLAFDQGNTPLATAGQNFDRLDPGQSITLLYRGTLDASVAPSEILSNTAAVVAFSVPVDSSNLALNQLADKGTAAAGNAATDSVRAAARHYAGSATAATVVIDNIVQDKVVDTTSVGADTSSSVLVGEQVRYHIELTIPLGTVPDLSVTDTLPAGLALVGTPLVSIGADLGPATPGTLVVNGQQLTWTFGETLADGPDRTITLDYVAQVRNTATNTAGATLTNNAAYNFTGLPGGVVNLTQRTVTVAEPSLTVTRGVRNATRAPAAPFASSIAATDPGAPDAGDILEYQLSVTNASGANISPAYDLGLQDTLPPGLVYVPGSVAVQTSTGLTGTLGEPDPTGQLLAWGRNEDPAVNLDLAPGGTLTFTYQARVADTSAPLQTYVNATIVDWTSLDGAPGPDLGTPLAAPGDTLGERIGTGTTPNLYRAAGDTPVAARNSTAITKTKAGDTLPEALPASGFRVGDLVTYTLTLPVQEGTLAAFTLADTLPPGLAFHDTVSITPATGSDGFTYTTPVAGSTAPALAATGALAWNFGTLVNTGDNDLDNDELVVVYRARVLPAAPPAGLDLTPADQTLNNTSTVAYALATAGTHTSAASIAPVVVRQPVLTLAKAVTSPAPDALGFIVRRPGDTAAFRITITNTGTAPAHNVALTDTLPAGLRATAPVLDSATLDAAPVALAPVWTGAAGTWVFTLADNQPLLPGEDLVLDYTVTVDNDTALRGATLTNSAVIDAFHSLPANDPEAASRRTYAPVGPATASLVVGLRIDGFVYHDIDLSDARDGAEDWSGLKPTVFANLVAPNSGNPLVFRTVTVPAGDGDFAFDYLPPGDFTVILTDSAGKLLAQRPANWLNVTPANGAIPVTINQGTGDLSDQNLGLDQGVFAPAVAPTITKTATGETIPEAGPQTAFRIGDLVTYTVDIFPHEGTNTTFLVTDQLPPGLAFHDTVSIAQLAGPARYTYVAPSGVNAPAPAAEGTLAWNFGTFTNAIADPANNTLRIIYRARVINTGTAPLAAPAASPALTTDALTNSAELGYGNAAVSLAPIAAGPATDAVTIDQPRLIIAKALTTPALNRLPPNATGTFTVTVTNNGSAPAYNLRVTDTLPVGLRATAPTLAAASLNGAPDLVGLAAVATWTPAAGTYVFNLADAQVLLPGQSLVLAYQFTVDADATRAATLTNSAVANQYFSKPSASPTHRRQYSPTAPATADIIVGLRIAGTVYEDDDLNDALTPGEDWTGATKPTLYVNLIDGLGALYASATIAPGTGAFEFTNLPEDDYTLLVATTPTALVSDRAPNWLYRSPNNGTHLLPDTDTDLVRDFGFWQDTLATAGITKTQAGGTLPLSAPADAYRIGDLVTYTVELAPQEGELTSFVLTDVLPAGLAFVETVSISQPSGAPRYTYTTPAGANAPAADATGTLTWTFGDFDNALNGPADNILRLTYTARILDTAGIAAPAASPAATTTARVNSATLAYDDQDAAPVSAGPATATLDVEQPRLIIAKTRLAPFADNVVMPGGTAQFRLTVTNNGSAPAYNVTLADTLPEGLRDATPVLDNATLNGGAFTPDSLGYVSATGVWTITLSDSQILLPAGQTLVLDYTVTVDADATKGAALTNSALVTAYASKASADSVERRVYDPTAPSTQDLIVGMSVAGSVYHQLIPNGVKDPGSEDWTTGTPVVVNLVANSPVNYGGFSLAADQVLRSVAVPVGAGDFTFTRVPAGDYRIVVTDTAVNPAAAAPATWTFDSPATGSITPLALTNADIADQHLGLYQGRVVSGRVYNDAAPFGSREAETWAGGVEVVVNLVNTYGPPVVHASLTVPAGVGAYEFTNVPPGSYQLVVAPAGQTAATAASAPSGWVFVEPDTGALGAFTVATSDLTDQDFGLTLGRTVSGFVFNDTNPNGSKDGFEDWLAGTPVVVNLIRASDNTVVATANVPLGAGDYAFTGVGPGDYRVVVTNAPGQTTAIAPPSWLFRNPASGSLNLTVAGADLADRNFALFRGRTAAGRVFRDNGAGSTAANNGLQGGSEPGISGVTVRLLSAGGSVLDTAQTNGSGDFLLRIPAATADGATLVVEETNPPVHRSTGGSPGDSGGAYNLATDRITFVYADADVAGLRFGDVPASSLLTDGAQTILPGATATYRHTFRAGTAGTVTFTATPTATPSLPWGQLLVRDLNCDGAIDPGEPVVHGLALTVAADEEICLLLRDNSPPNAPFGARHATVVTAFLDYANSPLDETLAREDVTTVGPASTAGLTLLKAVDKTIASPGEVLTYTITYTNAGAEVLTDLFIDDRTPAYTRFVSAAFTTTPSGLVDGSITAPAPNATGTLRWTFTGALAPGSTGTVTFQVQVTP